VLIVGEESSKEAIYRRFLSPHGRLTASELRYLTEVDHSDHEALMAVDRASGRGVGVARYVRDRERPEFAEIAVSVLETWQGRGIGKALLCHLASRARGGHQLLHSADAGREQAHAPALR
jgi:GNAT superfamily N-acetyltransferase